MQLVNKNIAILGLGLETLDLIHWLQQNNPHINITVFDQQNEQALSQSLQKLHHFPNISYSLGEHYLDQGLGKFDIIFRSPGFYRLHPQIIKAAKKGIDISSVSKLFFQLCPCPIIGVTGTKGKGTTASLIGEILNQSNQTAYVAGNIGLPPLQLLAKLKPKDIVCLELSSFQLQDLDQSPHIAVVLNITSEHLDVHHDTNEYRQAKTNIVAHQNVDDFAVINADYPAVRSFAAKTKAQVYWFSRQRVVKGAYVKDKQIWLNLKDSPELIGSTEDLLLRGPHNWENITAAITAAAISDASPSAIKQAVFSFKGLEHRLQLVCTVNGVNFYNDSFSTTPETAIAALQSFKEPIIIILGGSDKGSDYTQLGQVISAHKNLKAIILIGDMAAKIAAAIDKAGGFKGKIIRHLTTMKDIIATASQLAQPGDVVVLSPACASFDMFKNYKDRGQQFQQAVRELK